ncbi:MAG: rhomboid family intramembrane serine protease [Candidatus Eisenbacteria sp.]|nr:rhomboid family intramembrane serine protease [Candidatus Eisenbacteria bacterium]
MRGNYRQSSGGLAGQFTPVVKKLIIANVAVHFFSMIIGPDGLGLLRYYFALVPGLISHKFFLWQFFTYMYLHGSFSHLLFNMFALWMFGSMIESVWGSRRFFTYYTICGIGGGACTWLLSHNWMGPTLGASGAVFGLLLAYGMLFPRNYIYLWFVIPIRAKHFVILFGVIELLAGMSHTPDGIAHFAHLGGMLFGYIYIKRGFQLPMGIKIRMPKKPGISIVREQPPPARTRRSGVDEVLDKITTQGIDSLTPEEKRILEETDQEEDW